MPNKLVLSAIRGVFDHSICFIPKDANVEAQWKILKTLFLLAKERFSEKHEKCAWTPNTVKQNSSHSLFEPRCLGTRGARQKHLKLECTVLFKARPLIVTPNFCQFFAGKNSKKLRVTFTGRPLGPHAGNRLVAQIRARLVARIRVTFRKLGVTVQKLRVTSRKLRVTLSGIRGHKFEFGEPLDCSQEVDVVIWVLRLHCSTGSLPTISSSGSGLLKVCVWSNLISKAFFRTDVGATGRGICGKIEISVG